MFSCVIDDDSSDSDEDHGHVARQVASTHIGYILPPPEIVDDHASSVHAVAISMFGDIISCGCGEIYINRYGYFEEVSDVKGILCGFESIYGITLVYGVEPKFFTAHADGSMRSWNLLTRTPISCSTVHYGPILGLCTLQGADPVIITGGVDKFIRFYDPDMNLLLEIPEQVDAVLALAACWQAESSVVITGLANGDLSMWMYSPPQTYMKIRDVKQSEVPVKAIATAADIFCVGRYDGSIEVRAIRTGSLKYALEGHLDAVRSLAVHQGPGMTLVSGSWDGTVCLWDLDTGLRMQVLRGHTDDVTSVAVSEGPTPFVVSGSKDWSVRVWDISNIVKKS